LYTDYKKDIQKNGTLLSIDKEGTRNLLTAADNVPNTFLPYLILEKHTIYFDSIVNVMKKFDGEENPLPYFLMNTPKGIISVYPTTSAFLILPFYVIPFAITNPNINYYENILRILVMGRLVASFITTLSVIIMYINFSTLSKRKYLNMLLTIFFAFGTGMYTISSRGLWMHTTSILLITIVINFLLQKSLDKKKLFILGILLGFLILIRLTNVTVVLPIAVYWFIQNYKTLKEKVKEITPILLGMLPSFIVLLYTNYVFYGNILSNGYAERGDIQWSTSYTESIPGLILSPARGLLFLTPLLIVSLVRIKRFSSLEKLCWIITTIQILLIGKWWAWEGANAFGNRMLMETLPFLLIPLINTVKDIKNKYLIYILILLTTYSIYVHTNAVLNKKSRCSKENNWNFECLSI